MLWNITFNFHFIADATTFSAPAADHVLQTPAQDSSDNELQSQQDSSTVGDGRWKVFAFKYRIFIIHYTIIYY